MRGLVAFSPTALTRALDVERADVVRHQRFAVSFLFILVVAAIWTGACVDLSSAEEPAAPGSSGDFLLHRPRGAVGIRSGWFFARAGSDVFDFFENQLTVEGSDFDAIPLGVEVAFTASRRVQLLFGLELNRSSVSSEYRDWVDNHGQPITQKTSLSKTSVTGSVKFALRPRGEQVSALAWVPHTLVPYVGAGGGILYHKLEQSGDFVDFADLGVFHDFFSSEGWSPTAHVFGGVDVRVYRLLFVSFEGRYAWAAADLGADFVGFDPIDLSGFAATVGVSWVF
jgi:hypothetical protein